MITDVIIIGGGAAGLCAAVCIKKKAPEFSVRILEALPRVGKKLSLTGNGRCNISNKRLLPEHYHGNSPDFCRYALEKYSCEACADFFEEIGAPFCFEGDKAFPASLQAASVVDCLRFAADAYGVMTHLETKVTNIQLSGGNYKVIASGLNFLAKNVIIASGLYSGGERLGCDGSMLEILKRAGYVTVPVTPAIVQVKTVPETVKKLKGIKINALATLKVGQKAVRSEYGEVLFCDYGLSGPPILQISREVSRAREKTEISLDLFPEIGFSELYDRLCERRSLLNRRTSDEFFTGMLNKRLGQTVLKLAGCELNLRVSEIPSAVLKKTASLLKAFTFSVTGTTGFANSQVTAGGIETSQLENGTMMSRLNRGLYAVGEIVDIDGDCGGFNLQWAWSSAMCAADAVVRALK